MDDAPDDGCHTLDSKHRPPCFQLISGYGKDDEITRYIDLLDFYIIPCLNPDGYEYTRSSPLPPVRLWRKNRSPAICQQTVWGGEKCCQGVDLNRNFEFHWAGKPRHFPSTDEFQSPECRKSPARTSTPGRMSSVSRRPGQSGSSSPPGRSPTGWTPS